MKRHVLAEEKEEKEAAEARPEEDEDEDEDEEEEEELEVEFDLYNQTDADKDALVALLRGLLSGPEDDVEGLADAVVAADVGSVVKSQGLSDALAVITVLDMAAPQQWAAQIARAAGLDGPARDSLGLIVNERIVNMPTLRLAPAMHRSLFAELADRGPAAKQFERFLLLAPLCDDDAAAAAATADADAPLPKRSKKQQQQKQKAEFLRPEEEVYVEAAERATRVFLPTHTQAAAGGKSGTEDLRVAMAAVVDARSIPEVLSRIERLFAI